jgi:hypothetical protein
MNVAIEMIGNAHVEQNIKTCIEYWRPNTFFENGGIFMRWTV